MSVDFSSLPPEVPVFTGYGLFKGLVDKKVAYSVTFAGTSLEVPVNRDQYDNPPPKYAKLIVRGTLNTTAYGGRITADDLEVALCPDGQWPKDNEPRIRFEAAFELSKDSYGKEGDKKYKLEFKGEDFIYSAELPEDMIQRFPTGKHTLVGSLESYQFFNKRFGQWVTLWRAIPLGIPQSKRVKQQQ